MTWGRAMSDVLGFAESANKGQAITIYSAVEFFFEGIRFDPGTYEIRKVLEPRPSPDQDEHPF